MNIPIELWQIILDYSKHWDQVFISQLNTKFNKFLKLRKYIDTETRYNYLEETYKKHYGDKTVVFERNYDSTLNFCHIKPTTENTTSTEKIMLFHSASNSYFVVYYENFYIIGFKSIDFDKIKFELPKEQYTVVELDNRKRTEVIYSNHKQMY